MSYSKLVSHVKLSPNCSKPRSKKIDTITIHYMAGNATIEAVGNWFAKKTTAASSNYGIGEDGRIACYVEEENRSWCSSSSSNDNRAITIEVANYSDSSISVKAWDSLIDLCVDICQRYGFKLNYTGDKSGNLTMHKWFAATKCPGKWLEARFPQIADEVNKRLDAAAQPEKNGGLYCVQVGAFNDYASAEAQLAKVKAAGFDAVIVEKQSGAQAAAPAAPAGKTIDELAREVISGKWGTGSTRKKKLTAAGYNYAAIQKRVNELLLG